MNTNTLLLNFGHPLTELQQAEVATHLGHAPQIQDVHLHVERHRPLTEVVQEVVNNIGLSSEEWQTRSILINPPGLAPLALTLIAELHGRCGYFLPILHIRPVVGSLPPHYEVSELVNLNALRESARTRRQPRNNIR